MFRTISHTYKAGQREPEGYHFRLRDTAIGGLHAGKDESPCTQNSEVKDKKIKQIWERYLDAGAGNRLPK
jgi:hypothetical protein